MKTKIGILGCGAYGIALAKMFHENSCEILMWTKFSEEAQVLRDKRFNEKVLPNTYLDDDIRITTNLKEVCNFSDILVICIPSNFVRGLILEMKDFVSLETTLCMASKGIDIETGNFMTDLLLEHFPNQKIAIISGPSFAIDVVSKQPTGLTVASSSDEAIDIITKSLANKYLKLVPTSDVLGVSVCGSIKNLMAIASGMLSGFNANPSCNAMFLTEAIHEIKNLIKKLGGNDRTILSYAGIGDILLTCTSPKSRNFTFGYYLVTKSCEEVMDYRNHTTIEGLETLEAIKNLLQNINYKMPIIEVIDDIVNHQKNPKMLLDYLMNK